MFINYLKIAIRQIRRHSGSTFINVFGLAVGIGVGALIFLYVVDELTFDQFHEKGERIFRVTSARLGQDGVPQDRMAWQPYPLAGALRTDIPEVEEAVRVEAREELIRLGTSTYRENILFADAGFLSVFSFPMTLGDEATALDDPGKIVLSESTARKLFGDQNPVGQALEIYLNEIFYPMTVSGVAADAPSNSSIQFDYLVSFLKLPEAFDWIRGRENNWRSSSFFTYVLLTDGASREAFEAKMPDFYLQYRPDNASREQPTGIFLQPISQVHLDKSVSGGLTPTSDPLYSYILAAIALAILAIACINFTTLAIGRSVERAREVGVRKAAGARQGQLMAQFWGEALVLTLLATVLGIVIATTFLPEFNSLAGKNLSFNWWGDPVLVAGLAAISTLVGLVAGGYPAFILSRFKPVQSLSGASRLNGGSRLSQGLVVLQFSLSVFLIVGTWVMIRQLHHVQNYNLGFNKENVIVLDTQSLPGPMVLDRMRTAIGTSPDIVGMSGMSDAFSHGWSREGWDYRGKKKRAYVYRTESNILEVLDAELMAGRTFDPDRTSDSTQAVIVNEAFVRHMDWDDPLGMKVEGFYAEPVVVGVFRDLNFLSLHSEIEPLVFTMDPDWGLGELLIRVAPGDVSSSLARIESAWESVAPELPIQYSFLDQELDAQYAGESRWSRIMGYAAGFAVLIACLGLFGLAALAVARRTKEIGIRKVLGASVSGVVFMLSREFAFLVIVATLLAAPIAYLAIERWLESFAYRIQVSVWLFAIIGAGMLLVAFLTVAVQSVRAALTDPVRSLRHE
jgi:putative ABC transport system permease protein